MPNQLHAFLAEDHARLDALLIACLEEMDTGKYDEFRRGLLRHIGIEELVLFPLLRRSKGATELEVQLHRDHAAISALLMPPPTEIELRQIADILESHNDLEELPGGLYEIIEAIAGEELDSLMTKVHAVPPVRVARQADSPVLRRTIEQLLREADEGRRKLAESDAADSK